MKWFSFKNKDYLTVNESTRWLATDGIQVWIMYTDKDDIYFCSSTNENESKIEKRLTHWTWLENVPLPTKAKS